jgi:ABC-type bacteriocin/lantibiotic exporter with double-glycine peptidase domain
MNPVIQEEISGCGIASCAALAGITYAQAKETANALGIYAEDIALWSDTEYVRTLLRALGITVAPTETPFDAWESLPDKALLAIKWHTEQGMPFWHWVVFIRSEQDTVVLDSKKALKTNARRDFGRIKPKWFIRVD